MKRLAFFAMNIVWVSALAHGNGATSAPKKAVKKADAAAQKRVYTVATAHLDTNWLWTIQNTIDEYIPKTLNVNFAYFKEFPDYKFNFEGAFRYMLMQEYYPKRFAELQKYVKEGRWNVAGSAIVAGDTNMPSPESMIRQTLYANEYWMKVFHKRADDLFLPDCFGFGYALPSIAHHCGLIGFSTQKLTWGSAVGIPFSVGNWYGVDGSHIVAALDPGDYTTQFQDNVTSDPGILGQLNKLGEQSGVYWAYRYHGTGDRGGGPTPTSMKNMELSVDHPVGDVTATSARSDQLYRDVLHELTPAEQAKLPSYNGELVMTTHGTGCYTSEAVMKLFNRQNEHLAFSAEQTAAVADWMGAQAYPTEELSHAWVRFLWHQFHDDLTGTSLPQVYDNSWNDEALSMNNFSDVVKSSVGAIADSLNTNAPGTPVVVVNSLSERRDEPVQAKIKNFKAKFVKVLDANGEEVPSQILSRSSDGTTTLLFQARVPSMGEVVYTVKPSNTPYAGTNTLSVTPKGLESSRYKVTLDLAGDVVSVVDKVENKELLKSPIQMQLLDDFSQNWPAWELLYDYVMKPPRTVVGYPADVKVVENGPVEVGLQVTRTVDGSTFTQNITLSEGEHPRVDFPTHVEWHTQKTMVMADFNLVDSNPMATYDLGLGTIQRPNDTPQKYEVPAQEWADLTDKSGTSGVSILNNCKYGWDKPDDNTLRLTLLHTPDPGDNGLKFYSTNDLGSHDFTYSLYSHDGSWKNGTVWAAEELNHPLVAFTTDRHPGALGSALSFIRTDSPSFEVMAVKKAEDGKGLIVRVFEKNGEANPHASLSFPVDIKSAEEVDGQERPINSGQEYAKGGQTLSFALTPYEPRAFRVQLASAPVAAKPESAHAIALAYDHSFVGTKGEPLPAGATVAIPSALWPKEITSGGVTFNLGSEKANAVLCNGQVIQVPKGTTSVEMLVAGIGDDQSGAVQVGETSVPFMAPNFAHRIARWTDRVVDGQVEFDQSKFLAPSLDRTTVAWNSTHRLTTDGKVLSYKFCYLFRVSIPVNGQSEITLPTNSQIAVFSATAITGPTPTLEEGTHLYHWPMQAQ